MSVKAKERSERGKGHHRTRMTNFDKYMRKVENLPPHPVWTMEEMAEALANEEFEERVCCNCGGGCEFADPQKTMDSHGLFNPEDCFQEWLEKEADDER